MNTRHRNLLALALATALLSPAARAGKGGKNADQVPPPTGSPVSDAVRSEGPGTATDTTAGTIGETVSQTAREASAATQDTVTSNDAAAATQDATTSTHAAAATQDITSNDATEATQQATMDDARDAGTRNDADEAPPPARDAHGRMVKNPTNTEQSDREKAPQVPPTASQGAAHATDHASVTQRALWGRLDTDGDGQISAAESAVDAEFNAGFQAMDSNDDGLVTDAEYQVAARSDLGTGQAQGGVNAAAHSTASVRDVVARLDTNADGAISANEAQADAGFNANFATVDADSDGTVSSQEYQAWVKAQRK